MRRPARILSIAGSDCSGGAGLQADLKTITALGGYAMTAVTAVTVQNTQTVDAIYPVPGSVISGQIDHSIDDIGVDGIKVGMLGADQAVRAVITSLSDVKKNKSHVPVVIDPVMSATSGADLLGAKNWTSYVDDFLTLGDVVTPNKKEAERLLGAPIQNGHEAAHAAMALSQKLGTAILLKGGHVDEDTVRTCDFLVHNGQLTRFSHQRIKTRHTHGTGCTLSSALSCFLACGSSLVSAVQRATDFVYEAIKQAPQLGQGSGPLWPMWVQYPRGEGVST